MLSDLPAALIPVALLAALLERLAPSRETRFASGAATPLATVAAVSASVFGWWDWLTIPRDHEVRGPATTHGLINSGSVLGLVAAVLLPRRRLELLVGVNVALFVAAWIGGDLVYKLGWRVRPAEEYEIVSEHLRERGALDLRDKARAAVDAHERDDTFFPGRGTTA